MEKSFIKKINKKKKETVLILDKVAKKVESSELDEVFHKKVREIAEQIRNLKRVK